MTEQLITSETAKLAKNKKCELITINLTFLPTQSLLQKWLREVHKIHVNPEPYLQSVIPEDTDVTGYYVGAIYNEHGQEIGFVEDWNYATYEEALEMSLQTAFKTLKNT